MGVEGYINIWKTEDVKKEFPDADELFNCIPTHYRHKLDGVEYDHCYWTNNWFSGWYNENEWYWYENEKGLPSIERLREFVKWLQANDTEWEVWT